jgi:protein-tyrosine-phosphatase
MAEAVMRHELEQRSCGGIELASAGTWAGCGHPATPEAVQALSRIGIDLSSHRSRPLDRTELARVDLVVVMTSVHVNEVLSVAPEAGPKLLLLKQLADTEVDLLPPGASQADRVGALTRAPRPELRRAHDLDDPIGLPDTAYERCLSELRPPISRLVDLLCS